MRPPVWIILVLHAELASVRALLVKGLDHSNLPSTLELVCDVASLLHSHKNKIQITKIQILTNTYRRRTRTHTLAYCWITSEAIVADGVGVIEGIPLDMFF